MRFSELITDWRALAAYMFDAPRESFGVADRDSLWSEVARRGVVQIERRSLFVVGGAQLVHQTLLDEAFGVVGDSGASGHPGGHEVRRERERALASWSHVEGRLAGETGARQRELRGQAATLFRPDAIAAMEPLVRAHTRQLLEQCRDDLVQEVTRPLMAAVAGELLGVRSDRLLHWAYSLEALTKPFLLSEADVIERSAAVEELYRFLAANAAGVLPALKSLTPGERIGLAASLLVGGIVTPSAAVAALFDASLRGACDPADRADVARVFTELAPAQAVIRRASAPTEVGGVPMRAGSIVVVGLAAALDAESAGLPLATFGYGPHRCIGAALAKSLVVWACDELARAGGALDLVGTTAWSWSLLRREPLSVPVRRG